MEAINEKFSSATASKMEGEMVVEDDCVPGSKSNCEDLAKMLGVVVKRRKTFPAKCVKLNKQIAYFELLRLENAKVITERNNEKDEFKKLIQEFKNQKSFSVSLDDLNEVKQKLDKCCKRNKEINTYLEKRKCF